MQNNDQYWADVDQGLREIATGILHTVARKNREYDESWRKRGGVGAFMMLARKWDRIEAQAKAHQWDILRVLQEHPPGADGPQDDLVDLIGYLWLVLEYHQRGAIAPGRDYVSQDAE